METYITNTRVRIDQIVDYCQIGWQKMKMKKKQKSIDDKKKFKDKKIRNDN